MKSKKQKRPLSYIISVSLGKGCYRHIRISGKESLECLAGCILASFDFNFDHLYSFFMDNKWWSQAEEYHSSYDEEPPYANVVKMSELELVKGQQFKFLFDYGDEWRFQCKVLQVLEENTPKPLLVRAMGKAPEQYPDEDDETELSESPDIQMINFNYDDDHFHDEPEVKMDIPEIPDELMKAAFQFRSDKLWKKLYDDELFAVKLSNGEIGYCCIMGCLGECISLALYIGNEGLYSFEIIKNAININNEPFSIMLEQNCLQMGLDNKSDLPDQAILPVQKYAAENGINLKGKKPYPNFMKFQSYCAPWLIYQNDDFKYLLEALNAAHAIAQELKKSDKIKLGFADFESTIPLLTPDNDGYKWTIIELPEVNSDVFTKPAVENDVLIERIKKLKKHGTWECRHFFVNQPAFDEKMQKPVYPSLVLCAALDKKQSWDIKQYGYYPDIAGKLTEQLAEKILEYGACPETIITNEKRSFEFLENLCSKLEIKLAETDKFEVLDDIIKTKYRPDEDTQIIEMLQFLDSLSESQLRTMPDELMNMLCSMIGKDILPPSLENKLKKIK